AAPRRSQRSPRVRAAAVLRPCLPPAENTTDRYARRTASWRAPPAPAAGRAPRRLAPSRSPGTTRRLRPTSFRSAWLLLYTTQTERRASQAPLPVQPVQIGVVLERLTQGRQTRERSRTRDADLGPPPAHPVASFRCQAQGAVLVLRHDDERGRDARVEPGAQRIVCLVLQQAARRQAGQRRRQIAVVADQHVDDAVPAEALSGA